MYLWAHWLVSISIYACPCVHIYVNAYWYTICLHICARISICVPISMPVLHIYVPPYAGLHQYSLICQCLPFDVALSLHVYHECMLLVIHESCPSMIQMCFCCLIVHWFAYMYTYGVPLSITKLFISLVFLYAFINFINPWPVGSHKVICYWSSFHSLNQYMYIYIYMLYQFNCHLYVHNYLT